MSDHDEINGLNIRHFKLSSGEEIVAIVLDTSEATDSQLDESIISVQRPMQIEVRTRGDSIAFLFHEWQPMAKSQVCMINPYHVISHVECMDQIKEQYLKIAAFSADDPVEYDPSAFYDEDAEDELNITFESTSNPGNTYH